MSRWLLIGLTLGVQGCYGVSVILNFPSIVAFFAQVTGIAPWSLWLSHICSLISSW